MRIKRSPSIPGKDPSQNIRQHAEGFTLIELLVVTSVLMILFAVGVPLLSDSTQRARKSSADILRSTLQQARAHSIAAATYTSVLLPSYASDPESGGRLIGIAEVEPDETAPANYRVSRLIQRWTQLPEHIFFMDKSSVGITQNTLMDAGSSPQIHAEYHKSQLACNFIVFAPNGQILQNSSSTITPSLIVSLAKGTLKNGTVAPTQRNSKGVVFDLFQINRLTARLRQIDPLQ
jgi:type II secretory pathway pseudopilin PulG